MPEIEVIALDDLSQPLVNTEKPLTATWSQKLPHFQLAWDSTSLGDLKACPRRYFYRIALGYAGRGQSAHLTFGLLYHAATERYDHARAKGQDHESALMVAIEYCLRETWDENLNRPWVSDNNIKNRDSLLRTVIWYLDKFEHDSAETIILANGRPAVELSFRFELGIKSVTTGEDIIMCGHLDRVATFLSRPWVLDKKTTKYALDQHYGARYAPDNQMSLYDVAGTLVLDEPIAGIVVDAAQIGVTFSRFQRYTLHRHESLKEEWINDTVQWIRLAEHYASMGYWPMNDKSCLQYYSSSDPVHSGCPYRGICSIAPSQRQKQLDGLFDKRIWDPLQVRGDVQ